MSEQPHHKLIKATHAHARMHEAVAEAAAEMRAQLDDERQQRIDQEAQPADVGTGS